MCSFIGNKYANEPVFSAERFSPLTQKPEQGLYSADAAYQPLWEPDSS